MAKRFRRRGEVLVVSLSAAEVELLRSIREELRVALEAPPDASDAVQRRLWPRAYADPTEEDAERQWQELVHTDLVRERVGALDLLTATLERGNERKGRVELELAPEEAQAWLGALNDARLALGTRLGVTEDMEYENLDESDPDASRYAVYGWLSWVQDDLVQVLLG